MIRSLATIAATLAAATVYGLSGATAAKADSPELNYINDLTDAGFVIWDTQQALHTGYVLCGELDYRPGADVINEFYSVTPYSVLPDRWSATQWTLAAAINLCPRNFHPERMS